MAMLVNEIEETIEHFQLLVIFVELFHPIYPRAFGLSYPLPAFPVRECIARRSLHGKGRCQEWVG